MLKGEGFLGFLVLDDDVGKTHLSLEIVGGGEGELKRKIYQT